MPKPKLSPQRRRAAAWAREVCDAMAVVTASLPKNASPTFMLSVAAAATLIHATVNQLSLDTACRQARQWTGAVDLYAAEARKWQASKARRSAKRRARSTR